MVEAKNNIFDKLVQYCLWGLVFFMPFSKSFIEIMITGAIIFWCAKKIREKDFKVHVNYLFISFALFLAINAASVFYSHFFSLSLRAFFSKCLKFVMLFLIIYDTIDTKEKMHDLSVIGLISVFIVTLDGFAQKFLGGVDVLHQYPIFNESYVTASFPFPNDYATWIIVFLPVLLSLSLFGPWNHKGVFFNAAGTALLLFSLFLTKARGAWLGFFIALLIFSFIKMKKSLAVIFIGICIVAYALSPAHVKKDILSTISFKDRFVMNDVSVKMFKDHPIIGTGINSYFQRYMSYRDDKFKDKKGSYAHNCYLQTAVDLGIVGLAIFLNLLAAIFNVSFLRIKKMKDAYLSNLGLGVLVGIAGYCVYAAFDTSFYSLPLATLFWFSAGFLFAVTKVYERQN